MSIICGNLVGGITGYGKSFVLVDENDNELTGILVDEVTVFTATAEDIKLGKVAGTESGVVTGTHVCE
jgi:uncharacterized protein YjiK